MQYTSFRDGKDAGAYGPSYTSCLYGCFLMSFKFRTSFWPIYTAGLKRIEVLY